MTLSFCIPTYNRQEYLRENILAIIKQLNESIIDEVEICISDNCSTDGTMAMLAVLKNEFNRVNLVYKSNARNIGPDLNYLESVKISSGQYCWFLGSDDVLMEGSITEIINLIKNRYYDIIICNRLECDENLKPFYYKSWYKNPEKTEFNLVNKNDLLEYLNISKDSACIFSYLTSIIFYKEKWSRVEYDNSFTGTAYSHAFMLFSFLQFDTCFLKILDKPMVICRVSGGNTFLDKGLANRIFIDFDGYYKISKLHYFDKTTQNALLKIISNLHPLYRLLRIKCYSSKEDWNKLYNSLILANYPVVYLRILRLIPLSLAHSFSGIMPAFVWLKKYIRHSKFIFGIKN
jgi:abequosyltransferase